MHKQRKGFWAKPEKVRKMSVDIGGDYVVMLVSRKGAKIWQNAEQMARVTYANARMVAGRGGTPLAVTLSQAR